jgi:hypothetical protein
VIPGKPPAKKTGSTDGSHHNKSSVVEEIESAQAGSAGSAAGSWELGDYSINNIE